MFIRKKIVLEREKEYHINSSTPMNLYNMYILPIQIHICKLQHEKKNKKIKVGCKRDSMEGPLVNIYIYIYIEVLKF